MTDGKFNIGCVIPIHGRAGLADKTIARLSRQVNCNIRTVIVGDSDEDKETAKKAGVLSTYYSYRNSPLGAKWQFGIDILHNTNPEIDAYLHIGSDDWLSDAYCDTAMKMLAADETMAMIGSKGFFVIDYRPDLYRLIYWPGYDQERAKEPIGAGRLIPRCTLDALNWNLFDVGLDSGLDYSMLKKILTLKKSVAMIVSEPVAVMGIKLPQFEVKNGFDSFSKTAYSIIPMVAEVFLRNYFLDIFDIHATPEESKKE